MSTRPRARTFTTAEPTKNRPAMSEGDAESVVEEGITTEPAAAYISTRISPPPSPLPHYDNYKEQRLYNYVMSTSASHPSARHSRGQSISSIPENGNFFSGLFASSPTTPNPPALRHSRSQSLQPQGTAPGRKFSNFFGLGISRDDASSNSGLAFSSSSSSKRSVSNSTTLSNLVQHGSAGGLDAQNQNPMTRDEFADVDFAQLLNNNVPVSPLNCTPQGFHGLRDVSLELIDKLYSGYMERTRLLVDALAEIEALREDLEQKDQKIEGLRFSVDQLANVQETLSKAAEEAEKTAEKANQELKKTKAENHRLQWEVKSVREAEDDAASIRSAEKFGVKAKKISPPQMHTRTKSSNSDSGFESDTDNGSIFSHDYTPFKSIESSPAPNYPPSIMTVDEERYELESTPAVYNLGPLQHLRNVLKRTAAAADGRCDCTMTINRLKHENGNLVTRVKELEGCLDSCLDLVGKI
ncbi:hypothetical protein ABW19_dt0201990 [Dactylella cylindrospora]|nr:hypothetical protein ABW19_dt0201990 [Dactylella cylindrospora]